MKNWGSTKGGIKSGLGGMNGLSWRYGDIGFTELIGNMSEVDDESSVASGSPSAALRSPEHLKIKIH